MRRLSNTTRLVIACVAAVVWCAFIDVGQVCVAAAPLRTYYIQAEGDDKDKPPAKTDADANDKPDAPPGDDKTKPPDLPVKPDAPDKARPPDQAEPPTIPLQAVVVAVKGRVQVRLNAKSPWVKPTKGMKLPSEAEVRTGVRGAIQLAIPPDESITVDRLTTITLLKLRQRGGKRQTDIGMKYGRTRYEVEKAGIEHETTIRSPSSTLAVRGTKVVLFDQPPFPPEAYSDEGRAVFTNLARQRIAFGTDRRTDVKGDRRSAAESAAYAGKVDPGIARARSIIEADLVVAFPELLGRDPRRLFNLTKSSSNQKPQSVTGNLDFTLNFSGGGADLDLFVVSPLGETVSLDPTPLKIVRPGGASSVPSGGMFLGGDGTAQTTGREIIRWEGSFPVGTYSVGVQYSGGTGPSLFQLDVTQIRPTLQPTVKSFNGTLDAQNPVFIVTGGVKAGQ